MGDLLNVDMNYLIGKKESTEIIPDSYYLNPEARDMAQFLFENPEYKVLFDASRKVKPEDIQFVKEIIEIGAHKRNGNHYESVVLQVTLKEKLIGTASKNLKELEDVINAQAAKGYRLHHTITTASANSTGFGGGDRIQATMVFEKL